jgi:hypothetical protein
MPVPGRFSLRPALGLLCLPLLAAMISGLYRAPTTSPGSGTGLVDMGGWEMPDLLRHLQARGVRFRAVPTAGKGTIAANAFLTAQDRPWADLDALMKDQRTIARWKGVVFCERIPFPEARIWEVECWGPCGLWAYPFIFFGDPQMLAQLRAALAADPPPTASAPPS